MRRTTICIAAALTAALSMGAMPGCGNQQTAAPATDVAPAAQQSQEELVSELKRALANVPKFKSVTVVETTDSVLKDDAASADGSGASSATDEASTESNSISSMTIYKFDASGDKLKTHMTSTIEDVTLQYYSNGDDAVCVTDGPIYSGKTEQFDSVHFDGFEAYFTDTFGDLTKVVDCVDNLTKEQEQNLTVYTLSLNPQKYIGSDELLALMAESGDPIQEAVFVIKFDQDGHMVSVNSRSEYKQVSAVRNAELSEFDATVVDPMPKADKTYEEMEKDMDAKYDAFDKGTLEQLLAEGPDALDSNAEAASPDAK